MENGEVADQERHILIESSELEDIRLQKLENDGERMNGDHYL